MLETAKEQKLMRSNVFLFLGVLIIVSFVGVGITLSPVKMIMFSMLPFFLIVACWKFKYAVLLMLLFASGLVPEQLTPSFPFVGGTIRTEECVLAVLIFFLFFRVLFGIDKITDNNLYYPVYFFLFLGCFAFILALGFHNKSKFIAAELRTVLYWLFIFILACSIKNKSDIKRVLSFIIGLSVLLSIAVTVQSFTGYKLLNNSSVGTLVTVDSANYSISRSTFGGFQGFVAFSITYLIAMVSRKEVSIWIGLLLITIMAIGFLVTFGRGVWAVTFLVIFVTSIWLGFRCFIKIWMGLAIVVAVIALIFSIIKPEFIDAVTNRVLSINEEMDRGDSYGWRKIENKWAWKMIVKKPFGIGLGGEYKSQEASFMGEHETRILHNSYLWMALKFSVLCFLFPIWLGFAILIKAKKIGTSLSIALGASFLNPLLVSFTQMEWSSQYGVLFMATIVGLLIAHNNLENTDKKHKWPDDIRRIVTQFHRKKRLFATRMMDEKRI